MPSHPAYMSYNEYKWWIARNSIKPLQGNIANIYQSRISFNTGVGFSGKPIIPAKESFIDWYNLDKSDEWAEAKENASREQKIINESIKDGQ